MGLRWFKTSLQLQSIDSFMRMDVKFHKSIDFSNWNLFNAKSIELEEFKDIFTPYYENFDYQDKVYKGIPTGREYLDEFGDIISYQEVTFDDHPGRLKYKADNDCLLLSSLRGARTPALNFQFDLTDYVFSNGFYIFKIKEKGWDKRFILNLLRTNKIKDLFDNSIYRGIGISSYREDDFLKIKIPKLPLPTQRRVVEQITPIEQEIHTLKKKKVSKLDIINNVFGEEFGYTQNDCNRFGKGMTAGSQKFVNRKPVVYKCGFSSLNKSRTIRFSTRYNNPNSQYFYNLLYQKPTIKISNVINDIVKGIQPEYDTSGDIPVVKIANLKNDSIDLENPEFISLSSFEKLGKEMNLIKNDVIFCCTGKCSLGKIDIVDFDNDAILSVDSYCLRINDQKYNPYFFTYFFRSILGTIQFERDYTGTTNQIHLYEEQILDFDIPDISLEKQSEIVSKIEQRISAQKEIDDKIESKRQEISKLIENIMEY